MAAILGILILALLSSSLCPSVTRAGKWDGGQKTCGPRGGSAGCSAWLSCGLPPGRKASVRGIAWKKLGGARAKGRDLPERRKRKRRKRKSRKKKVVKESRDRQKEEKHEKNVKRISRELRN